MPFHRGHDARPGILLCSVTLLFVAAIQYWIGPSWRIWRRKLRSVDAVAVPGLGTTLRQLANEYTPNSSVYFLLDIVNPAISGLAFGGIRRSYIVLSRGLIGLFENDREKFEAVVLHELAHVRNRDLGITSFTLALWRSFVIVVILPRLLMDFPFGVLLGGIPTQVIERATPGPFWPVAPWILAAQTIGLAILAGVTRYSVLRSRELYADARVVEWRQDCMPLRELFESVRQTRRLSPMEILRKSHPSATVRVAALSNVSPLIQPGLLFSVVLGACFSFAMDPATSATAIDRNDQFYWPAELFALVLAVALSLRALRWSVFARSTGDYSYHTHMPDRAGDRSSARCSLSA
ncbi:M48 family metalloprotease [Nocardia sp. NPDC004711]